MPRNTPFPDHRRTRRSILAVLGALPLLTAMAVLPPAPAKADIINQSFLSGVAIEGYDPVAYFTDGKPVEGSSDHSYDWMGAEWHFANADNLEKFKAEPEKYAPAYGGYCAWAVSQGYTAEIDPEAWKIVDGQLYLNYNKDIQTRWAKDIPGNIEKADRNWPKIKEEL